MDHNNGDKSGQFGGFFLICSFLTFVAMLTYIINATLYKDKQAIIIEDGASRSIVLTRSFDNHFHVDAKLNNVKLGLLVDTGASYLTISQKFAEQLQLPLNGTIVTETANGQATGYISQIAILDINGIIFKNVKILIAPNLSDDSGLLGVNILRHFTIVEDKEQMILTVGRQKDA